MRASVPASVGSNQGWKRDQFGWVATDEETTHRVLGVRGERVVAHGPAPRGFLVHGGDSMLWTAYLNGGVIPRGAWGA
jgi:hypothetical protein